MRRPSITVIVLALVASFAAGSWLGPLQGGRDPVVGAGVEPSVEDAVRDGAVGEVSEVRPTDLVERARERGVAPPPPGPDDFVTPSGNILCAYAGGQLDCHIGSGLAPPPAHRCSPGAGDWSGIRLGHRGPSLPWCTNVQLADRAPPPLELAYGRRWARDGIECTSRRDGLRCHNDGGGEFLLSRAATRHGRDSTRQ